MLRARVLVLAVACAGASARAVAPSPAAPSVQIAPAGAAAAVDGPVLAVAFLGDERLVVLGLDALRVYRWRDGEATLLSQHALPEPEPVRFPGGLLLAAEDAVWVSRSGLPAALLFGVDGRGTLTERARAEALPWPACPRGLRYRDGTNLLEGEVEGLAGGPFLALASGVAVDAQARILVATDGGPRPSAVRAGPALVALGDGLFAAASASPPGPSDTILFLEREAGELRLVGEAPVAGAVRSLASAPARGAARLVAAVEEAGRATLLAFVVRRAGR